MTESYEAGSSRFDVSPGEYSLQESGGLESGAFPEPAMASERLTPPRPSVVLPLILFFLTCLSTWAVGGWEYSLALMSILLAHEMGHFLQCVRYRVPATLPLFIPMPTIIGTMGAVIVQRGRHADRKQMFDIAVSGPLAGLVVAIPALIWGLNHSNVAPIPTDRFVYHFGEPLLVQWLVFWKFGPLLPGEDTFMHPVAMAGWVGIFITALNLLPVSQLDGGHILYCLLGKKAHLVAVNLWRLALLVVIIGGTFYDPSLYSWTVMLFLIWLMGLRHPATRNDDVPLGPGRRYLGWATLAFILIGFTPNPISISEPTTQRDLVQAPTPVSASVR
ncbi:MAG: site-2 protease family protein [Planctomycetales bacterium]